uniref:Uncharacterized protein n=1 Tax=Parascaris equorum TaxID=6256 RepID=A0A914RD97_PAREQ
MSYNYLFKIVVVGDHSCGKSCILLRFAENSFRHDHISMERYRTIYNSYYHSAHGVMCVYDLTDERSFENLQNYWLRVSVV